MKTKRDCSFLPFQFAINVDLLYNIMKCNLEEYAMNAVGGIENFIITYQEPLQVAALAALAAFVVAVVICIGKAIASAGRKQRMLEEISEAVSEINTNVKNLGEKRTEVIYIDGCMTPEASVPAQVTESKTKPDVSSEPGIKEAEQKKTPEVKTEPAVKYFSRDCAVAKDGRHYTFEELDAQIRD